MLVNAPHRLGPRAHRPTPVRAWTCTRLLACALLCLGAACTRPKPVVTAPPPPPTAVKELSPGSTLAVPRPTPGVARLALWFDAGSRDAEPAQLATVSAWWAAQVTGASARVLPDGTELTLVCDRARDDLRKCVERLAGAFGLKPPNQTDVRQLRERLRTARRRAASSEKNVADELALKGLFGDAVSAMLPFGRESDDAALTPQAVVRFTGAHFVPSRALLVGAGDVSEAELAQTFAKVSANANSRLATARKELSQPLSTGLTVQAGSVNWLSLAMAAPSLERANTIGHRFREIYAQAEVRVASVRGAHLVTASMPAGRTPVRRLQRAAFDLQRLAIEAARAHESRPEESLENIVRLLGENWAARGPGPALTHPWPLGAALLVRDDSAPTEANSRLSRIVAEAEQAFAAGVRNATPALRGDVTQAMVRARTENGVRIEVKRWAGDAWMSALVRFGGGSGSDPLTRHGRAALLATLMADGCGFAAGSALDARLAALDAKLTPLLSATHTGLLISAPTRHAEEAVDVLLRCAVRPALTARALEDARIRLLEALWSRPDARLSAALGQLVAPTAPGHVAPWGAPDGIAAVQLPEVRRWHADLLRGANLEVLVIADQPADELAHFAARRLAHLAPGKPFVPPTLASSNEHLRGELTEKGPLRVVLGVRTAASSSDGVAPFVFSQLLAQALRDQGEQVLWHAGDSDGAQAWGGVALALSEEALNGAEALALKALREVSAKPEARVRESVEQALLAQRAQQASASGYARAFFYGRLGDDASVREALSSIRKLSQAKPAFFVLRPAPR